MWSTVKGVVYSEGIRCECGALKTNSMDIGMCRAAVNMTILVRDEMANEMCLSWCWVKTTLRAPTDLEKQHGRIVQRTLVYFGCGCSVRLSHEYVQSMGQEG